MNRRVSIVVGILTRPAAWLLAAWLAAWGPSAWSANRNWVSINTPATSFEDSANWDTKPLDDIWTDTAVFGARGGGVKDPSLTQSRSIRGLNFSAGGWTLGSAVDGGGNPLYTLTVQAAALGDNIIVAGSGNNTITAKIALSGSGYSQFAVNGASLTVGTPGSDTVGALSGSARVYKTGNVLVLYADNTGLNGALGIELAGGTIRVGNDKALGTGTFRWSSGTLTAADATARTIATPVNWASSDVVLGAAAPYAGTLNFTGPWSVTHAGQSMTFNSNAGISGDITIAAGKTFLKLGAGSLTLSGNNTSFLGIMSLGAGALRAGYNAAQPNYVLGNGTVQIAPNTTISSDASAARTIAVNLVITSSDGTRTFGETTTYTGDMTFNGTLTLANTPTFLVNNTTTFNGLISGASGTLTKSGPGTLVVNNSNSYPAGTTIGAGAAVMGNANAFGTGGAITVNAGGVIKVAGGVTLGRSITINAGGGIGGAGTFNTGSAITVQAGGRIQPGDGGAGILTLANGLTLAGARLETEFKSDLSSNDLVNVSGGILANNGAAVYIYTEGTTNRPSLTAGTWYNIIQYAVLAGGVSNLFVANPDPAEEYLFDTSGGYIRVKAVSSGDTNWVTTANANSNGWNTASIWSDGQAPSVGKAYEMLNGAIVVAPAADGRFGGSNLRLDSGSTLYWGAAGTGSGGTITIPNALTLNGGTILAPADMNKASSILTAGGVVVMDGTTNTLDLRNVSVAAALAGVLSGGGTIRLTGYANGGSWTLNTASPGFTGAIDVQGSGGTAVLSPPGTRVSNADVYLKTNSKLNGTTCTFRNVHLDGGTIYSDNSTLTCASLIVDSGGGELNNADFRTDYVSGPVSGSGALTKTGNGGFVLSSGANGYTGQINIVAGGLTDSAYGTLTPGRVDVAGGASFGAAGVGYVNGTIVVGSLSGAGTVSMGPGSAATATLSIGSDDTSTAFSGGIQNASTPQGRNGAILKVGAGALTLSGVNTYSESTTVSNGALIVTGSLAAPAKGVTVCSGATLGGTGRIDRAVAVVAAGALSPGVGPAMGTLTVSNLTLNAGCTNVFHLGAVGSSDRVDVNGDLSVGGVFVIAALGATAGTHVLAACTGTLTVNSPPTLQMPLGRGGLLEVDPVQKQVRVAVFPRGTVVMLR